MPGFKSDHINLIADNLRDRYKSGFPILKELIQNADDARASHLSFGYHDGFKGKTDHVLLQGPGLWVFNDGVFKETDRKAIQSFGLNNKAGESGSIGKFGLGMKSVFHLCEAFFYVAFDGVKHFQEILNPWYDPDDRDSFHNHWETLNTKDFDGLLSIGDKQGQTVKAASWLILWIPLRQRSHVPLDCGTPVGAIVDRYPGDDAGQDLAFLSEPKLSRQIAATLPLLKHLQQVELYGRRNEKIFSVALRMDEGSQRIDHKTSKMTAIGVVDNGGHKKQQLKFLVSQKADTQNKLFYQLRNLDVWPKTMRQNGQGKREQVLDKSEAEGAIMFAHHPSDEGYLQILWAVFLPTEEGGHSYEFKIPFLRINFRIVLHGQFFVDAGRRGIAGYKHLSGENIEPKTDLDDAGLHTAWNQAIAQKVVLEGFLPALADYADKYLSEDEIDELILAITCAHGSSESGGVGGRFLSVFGQYIHAKNAYIRQLTVTGKKWSLIELQQSPRLLQLPAPPKSAPARPWQIFPMLDAIPNAIFCEFQAPAIASAFSNWDEETLLSLFDVNILAGLNGEPEFKYLISFLEMEKSRFVGTEFFQHRLIKLIQAIFQQQGLDTLRGFKSTVQKLIEHVDIARRVAIGTIKSTALSAINDELIKLLSGCETNLLLIPQEFDPEQQKSDGQPDPVDIGIWIKVLGEQIARYKGYSLTQHNVLRSLISAIESIFVLKGVQKSQLVRSYRNELLLTAIDPLSQESYPLTFDELEEAKKSRNVFKIEGIEPDKKFGIISLLAKAAPSERFWIVNGEVAKILLENETTPVPGVNDGKAILESIGDRISPVKFGNVTIRRELINVLSNKASSQSSRKGLRYLLHANPTHFSSLEEILWIEPGNDSPWVKLWRVIEPDAWNVIEQKLADVIIPANWEKLGIAQVQDEKILQKLQSHKELSLLDQANFTLKERETILARVDDETLWRRLPLHQDIHDVLGALSEECYLESSMVVPEDLENSCRIIKKGTNEKLARKQEGWLTSWGTQSLLHVALKQSVTWLSHNWRLILDVLGNLDGQSAKTLNNLVTTTAWLPLQQGQFITPENVIILDSLQIEIDLLAIKSNYEFAGVAALSPEVSNHPNFQILTEYFSLGEAAVSRLSSVMTRIQGYAIGAIDIDDDFGTDELKVLASVDALPAWSISAKVAEEYGLDSLRKFLLVDQQPRLELDKLVEILNEITQSGKTRSHQQAFNRYLKLFASYGDEARKRLIDIYLLSATGDWSKTSELCFQASGVDKRFLLDDSQGVILGAIVKRKTNDVLTIPKLDLTATSSDPASIAEILELYFRDWGDLLQRSYVGAFLSFLGPDARKLANEWLQPHSFGWLVDHLGWIIPGYDDVYQRMEWMGGFNAMDALDVLKPIVRVINDQTIMVTSLLGEPIEADLDQHPNSIIAGMLSWKGGYSCEICLRRPPRLTELSADELASLLKKSCQYLLKEAYNQKKANLNSLWSELDKTDQLSLDVARGLILENMPFYLQQLKVAKKDNDLKIVLKELDQLNTKRYEAESSGQKTEVFNSDIAQVKRELAKLMATNPMTQKVILEGVRSRVKDNQYELSSIPFELFQNADDAVSELQQLQRNEQQCEYQLDAIGRFVVETDHDSIRFIHWGRPVNYMGHGDARVDEYGNDLKNMLILSASDKNDEASVVGKFGLGFKSVLLATDTPCILSGNLKVKIVAGCLPEPWVTLDKPLKALQEHAPKSAVRLRGTVIELPVGDEKLLHSLVARFNALAGMQAVFGCNIRKVEVDGTRYEWRPRQIPSCGQIEFGNINLQFAEKSNISQKTGLVVFRTIEGAMVLRLDHRGFVPFNDEGKSIIPSIWVTSPTREATAKGFVLNARFRLDTGRGGLPHGESSKENKELARQLAQDLACQLYSVVSSSKECWPETLSQIDADCQLNSAEFWSRLWSCIWYQTDQDDQAESSGILSHFGREMFAKYIGLAGEIPNGLTGAVAGFAKVADVALSIGSRWSKHLDCLAGWSEFTSIYPLRTWVSEDVADALDKHTVSGTPSRIVRLKVEFLFSFMPEKRCSPESMEVLLTLLSGLLPVEEPVCKREFSSLRFMAQDGSWQSVSNLLYEGGDIDEYLCWSFAPDSSKFNTSYSDEAKKRIRALGGRWVTNHEMVTQWIIDAVEISERKSALTYLLQGRDAYLIVKHLSRRLVGTWLEQLTVVSLYLDDFDATEKQQILSKISKASEVSLTEEQGEELYEQTSLRNGEALEKIYEWWQKERKTHLPRYEKHLWPENFPRNFESDCRISWMTLFAIGLFQRHGRTRSFQNRGFIEVAAERGWWKIFSSVPPQDDPSAWMNILKEYGESQVEVEEYSQWMDNFPRLYRLARWLNEYIHVFRTIDIRDPSQLPNYLTPSVDAVMSGSGIDAPALQKSLRLGQHLVVRELLRSGTLQSELAKSLAYIPARRVLRLLEGIGFQAQTSQEIYLILQNHLGERSDFNGYYDIPLLVLAGDPALQQRLFQCEALNETFELQEMDSEELDDEFI